MEGDVDALERDGGEAALKLERFGGDNELTPSRGVPCQYLSDVVNLIEKPR